MKKIVSLIATSIIFSGCVATDNKVDYSYDFENLLKNKRMHLVEVNGEEIPYYYNTNIHFKNNEVENYSFFTSKTPCNRVFGDYVIEGNTLKIKNYKETKNICTDFNKNKTESIMKNLYNGDLTIEKYEEGIILKNANNYMKFKKNNK
tara:strand:- start:1118 stop:1561 length:444 start_codon:yes stop_codon:yes gene_type:complete